jgi:tRNA (mo5U34)-methyltransferase
MTLTPSQIETKVRSLGQWFHNLDLNGVRTAPEHFLGDYPNVKFQRFAHAIPSDLRGKSVLDVGCNAGFYSIEMKRRGAERVVGIDSLDVYLEQARFAAEVSEVDIEFRKMSVYDIHELGEKFDVVIFMGVLYHLRHPLLALDLLYEYAVGDLLLFQSMLRGSQDVFEPQRDYEFVETSMFEEEAFPKAYFVEHRYAHDPTNWWIPNSAGVQAMLRSAGFTIETQAEDEVFLCRRGERPRAMGEPADYVPAAFEVKR